MYNCNGFEELRPYKQWETRFTNAHWDNIDIFRLTINSPRQHVIIEPMAKVLKSSLQFSATEIQEFILSFVPQRYEEDFGSPFVPVDLPYELSHKLLWSHQKEHPVAKMFSNIGFTMETYSISVTRTESGPLEFHLTLDPRGWRPKWRPMMSRESMTKYFSQFGNPQ